MNIFHETIRAESNVTHGPISQTTRGATWCPVCRQWVKTQLDPDPALVAQLAPVIDRLFKSGRM